ncbi:MAG TPA: hypothetical protein VLA12_11650, partial [Planctomycetaceae bacterium]|nr:hypothetical protein [Planctomycetaceae bacterium]
GVCVSPEPDESVPFSVELQAAKVTAIRQRSNEVLGSENFIMSLLVLSILGVVNKAIVGERKRDVKQFWEVRKSLDECCDGVNSPWPQFLCVSIATRPQCEQKLETQSEGGH